MAHGFGLKVSSMSLEPRVLSLPHYPPASEIPRGQFHNHPIADQHTNEILVQAAADVRRNPVPVDFHVV